MKTHLIYSVYFTMFLLQVEIFTISSIKITLKTKYSDFYVSPNKNIKFHDGACTEVIR